MADTKRDAVALLRAVIHADREGAGAVTRHTPCQGCLAVQLAVLATVLLVEDASCLGLDERGNVKVTGSELDRLDEVLAGMQGSDAGRGEG